jgi:hypothetical protein
LAGVRSPRVLRRAASSCPAALAATLLAILVQFTPLLFMGRPLGVGDTAALYAPWAAPGAPPPANPLLDDAATAMQPWLASWKEHPGELLAIPGVACGAAGPLAGVFGLLSPMVVLPFFLLPRALAFSGMAFLDLALGFVTFYAWRRSRGDGDVPAALGAAVWAWAPARAVYRTWPFCGVPILFPLLLWAVDIELSAEPKPRASRRALAWAALTVGFVLGGHPSFGAMGLTTAAAYGLARALSLRPLASLRGLLGRALSPALCGVGAALLLVAPVLALGRAFLVDGGWRELRAPIASAPPVPWRILFLLFDPAFYGDPVSGNWRSLGWKGPDNLVELQLYMGLATLLLAPLGLASRRLREAVFWAALAAAVLLANVAGGPFAAAARLVPGIDLVFLPRLRLVFLFAAAVLTAFGAEVLRRHRLGRPRLVLPAFLLFTTLDLSLADLRFDPFPARPDAAPATTPALAALQGLAPGNGRRFLGFGTALIPNLGMDFALEDVRAHLLFSAGYRKLVARLDPGVFGRRGTYLTFEPGSFQPDPFVLDLLGVAAVIAPPGSPPPGGDFTPAHTGEDADVYGRPWHVPARLVAPAGTARAETGRVTSFAAERTRWTVGTETAGPATLLLGRSRLTLVDRVRVDGAPARARVDPRAEGLLAVDVPAGRHAVTVDAALPPRFLALSAAGLAALLAIAASALRPARLRAP